MTLCTRCRRRAAASSSWYQTPSPFGDSLPEPRSGSRRDPSLSLCPAESTSGRLLPATHVARAAPGWSYPAVRVPITCASRYSIFSSDPLELLDSRLIQLRFWNAVHTTMRDRLLVAQSKGCDALLNVSSTGFGVAPLNFFPLSICSFFFFAKINTFSSSSIFWQMDSLTFPSLSIDAQSDV